MSELRVDNIVSEDGTAAPVYSKGMTIGAGQTLTCTGDFSVGGNVTFDSGATVTGVVTFSSADLQTNLSVSSLNVSGVSTLTGVSTFSDTVNVGAGKSIRLYGATSGYTEIVSAAGSGSTTFVLPANGGSASQYLQTDGSGVLSWQTVSTGGITWLDTVDTSSTGSFTVTGINTDSRMIVVSFYQVSQSQASNSNQIFMRVGNGSINSGNNYYWSVSRAVDADSGNTGQSFYRLLVDTYTSAAMNFSGTITLLRTQDSSNPLWSISHLLSENGGGNEPIYGAGSYTDTVIDRIQFVAAGTFDNGAVRVGYIL